MSAYHHQRQDVPATQDEGIIALLGMVLVQAADDVRSGLESGVLHQVTLEQTRALKLNENPGRIKAQEIESIQARDWLLSESADDLTRIIRAVSGVAVKPSFFITRARRQAAA
jgi:hypothetical protein